MGTKYGLTPQEWDAAKEEIRQIVIAAARAETTITYGEVTAQMLTISPHPGSYVFQALLRAMCRDEDERGHPMLCALVVSKAKGVPGAGYFTAMAGATPGDPLAVWEAECERVYAFWQKHTD